MLLLPLASFGMSKEELKKIVKQAEKTYQLPPSLLDATIQQESSYQIFADNPSTNPGVRVSSYGLGQLTLDSAAHHCNLPKEYIHSPTKNIQCAAKILKYQLSRYHGNIYRAVAAYNWGTPCECDGKVYKQTRAKIRVCLKTHKGKKMPIRCKQRGTFLNQDYVDGVLSKRTAIIKKEQRSLFADKPEEAANYIASMFTELRYVFF